MGIEEKQRKRIEFFNAVVSNERECEEVDDRLSIAFGLLGEYAYRARFSAGPRNAAEYERRFETLLESVRAFRESCAFDEEHARRVKNLDRLLDELSPVSKPKPGNDSAVASEAADVKSPPDAGAAAVEHGACECFVCSLRRTTEILRSMRSSLHDANP